MVGRIVGAVGARAGETIIEIGPGQGALTEGLVSSGARVLAIEFDRELVPALNAKFGGRENFRLIEADALDLDFCSIIEPDESARVVANLPYYISTAILQRLIEQRACLTEMVLMLQREVVERITSQPRTRERGYLTVLVEAYAVAEPLFDVAPESFRPRPKVWSTVVRLRLRKHEKLSTVDEALLWKIVSAGFAQRRKTILNNLRSAPVELLERIEKAGGVGTVLESARLEPQRRAETLTLEEWLELARALS